MMISLLYLYDLGEAVDVADIPVILVLGHVGGAAVREGAATRGVGRFCVFIIAGPIIPHREQRDKAVCHGAGFCVCVY
jgi:hypothetical protein